MAPARETWPRRARRSPCTRSMTAGSTGSTALCTRFGGGPVGLSTLAVSVGEEPGTVEEVAEPFLVREGLMTRTPRGRVATPHGWHHLGLAPPEPRQPGPALFDLPAPAT